MLSLKGWGKLALRNLGNLLSISKSALIELRNAVIKRSGVCYEKAEIFAL